MARGGARPNAGRPKGAINKATQKAREMAEAGGIMPLEFMLQVMRDETADRAERLDMAKAAAPYVHPRLSSVEAKVEGDVSLQVTRIELVGG